MFKPKTGDVYYSVGPLQNISGIEKWNWTEDVYDFIRMGIGNVFETYQEAKEFKEFLVDIKNKKEENELQGIE